MQQGFQYQLLPDLSEEEYQALKADIAARGVMVPVEYDEQGNVLDGHHRVKICNELGITDWPRVVRPGMSEDQKREHVLALNLARRQLSEEQRAKLHATLRELGWSLRQIAAKTGVDKETVRRDLTSGVAFATPETVTGKDGKEYPAQRREQENQDDRPQFDMGLAAIEMAEKISSGGDGLTVDEWEREPDEYVGHCYKQCYGPRVMTKGPVYEYGAYGVYVCTGCGYAYPPRMQPDKVTDLPSDSEEKEAAERDPRNYHVSDDSYEWYTPAEYIEAARSLMGSIDLDPASCDEANEVVKADRYYTLQDDGLTQPWAGNVWLNPPYNMPWIERFAERILAEYETGNVKQALVLTNNATDTGWFHRLMEKAPFCLTKGRIRFWGPGGEVSLGPRQGQAIFYIGVSEGHEQFKDCFGRFGAIVARVDDDYTER